MPEFYYTNEGDFDPNDAQFGYKGPISVDARTLDFGPGNLVAGYEQYGSSFVYVVDGPEMSADVQPFPLTAEAVGLYGDSSDFNYVTRVTGGDFGDVFRTGDGDDTLNGGGGNDVLEGGSGTNTFDGGAGTNTLSYEHFNPLNPTASFGMIVDLSTGKASDWSTGAAVVDTFSNISNVLGSVRKDGITGDSNNNVIEGGAGDDELLGGGGVDTLSYVHSGGSVNIDLVREFGIGGDAEDDKFTSFENVLGSTFGDVLYGDGGANTLNGNGGSDELYGRDGNDRLVISDSPVMVDGGEGTDLLFVARFGNVELTDESFAGIEKVYVRDGASLTMAGVDIGTKIFSQSLNDGSSKIVGTDGADRIVAGKGDDFITSGKGGDSLFGGAGANIFEFASGDGRDVIRKFDVTEDALHIGLITQNMDDVKIRSFHGEANTIITFTGDTGASNKIILLDVTADSVMEGNFLF